MGNGEFVKELPLARLSIGFKVEASRLLFGVVVVQMLFEGSWMNAGRDVPQLCCATLAPAYSLVTEGCLGCYVNFASPLSACSGFGACLTKQVVIVSHSWCSFPARILKETYFDINYYPRTSFVAILNVFR
jgi:hypothetical protein